MNNVNLHLNYDPVPDLSKEELNLLDIRRNTVYYCSLNKKYVISDSKAFLIEKLIDNVEYKYFRIGEFN